MHECSSYPSLRANIAKKFFSQHNIHVSGFANIEKDIRGLNNQITYNITFYWKKDVRQICVWHQNKVILSGVTSKQAVDVIFNEKVAGNCNNIQEGRFEKAEIIFKMNSYYTVSQKTGIWLLHDTTSKDTDQADL